MGVCLFVSLLVCLFGGLNVLTCVCMFMCVYVEGACVLRGFAVVSGSLCRDRRCV